MSKKLSALPRKELLRLAKVGYEVEAYRRRPRCQAQYCYEIKSHDIHKRPWGRDMGMIDPDTKRLSHQFFSMTKHRKKVKEGDRKLKKMMEKIHAERNKEAAAKATKILKKYERLGFSDYCTPKDVKNVMFN